LLLSARIQPSLRDLLIPRFYPALKRWATGKRSYGANQGYYTKLTGDNKANQCYEANEFPHGAAEYRLRSKINAWLNETDLSRLLRGSCGLPIHLLENGVATAAQQRVAEFLAEFFGIKALA
jgi:hypothetical protein